MSERPKAKSPLARRSGPPAGRFPCGSARVSAIGKFVSVPRDTTFARDAWLVAGCPMRPTRSAHNWCPGGEPAEVRICRGNAMRVRSQRTSGRPPTRPRQLCWRSTPLAPTTATGCPSATGDVTRGLALPLAGDFAQVPGCPDLGVFCVPARSAGHARVLPVSAAAWLGATSRRS
jgi:hypothetical protein